MLLLAIMVSMEVAVEAAEVAITAAEAVPAAMGLAVPAIVMESPAPHRSTTWHPILAMDLCCF